MWRTMATIQPKISRGHKYWYIVESRRINGKPRPIVLEYLGKADDLLKRLRGLQDGYKIKSFSHGAVSALLNVAQRLEIPSIINKHVNSYRKYQAQKPIRNNLTAGMTFLLGAIGRVCKPTSKDGWYKWAKTTSLEYLLRSNFSKIDSQHFWDMMDCLPIDSIEKIESEVLQKVSEIYGIEDDTLLFDTTNFHTFIATTNKNNSIAQRGKNKQKRNDLRQIGLAMAVTRRDFLPLFHLTYQGNINDSKIFREFVGKLKKRLKDLGMDFKKNTLVFDRGNVSKKNLDLIKDLKLHYVSALTPYHHKKLIDEAIENFQEFEFDEKKINLFRAKKLIWNEERTVLVFISDKLKAGQIRGIYQVLNKKKTKLAQIKKSLSNPKSKKRNKNELETKIEAITKGQHIKDLIVWSLTEQPEGKLLLEFSVDQEKLVQIEDSLGFRILMTDQHHWENAEIIKAFNGQFVVENAFKNIKNHFHLAFRPQFHWTDQKIKVHYFICVMGYLMATIIWRQARLKAKFTGTLGNLITLLSNVRLSTILEKSNTRGQVKAINKIEEMLVEEKKITECLGIQDMHLKKIKLKGLSVYT